MGVYIKGMEVPKNCFECPWRCKVDPENLLCRISGEYFEETFSGTIQNRHKSCPLVEIPPHGRLIDADKLCLSSGFSTATEYGMGRSDQIEAIKSNAPTIIPAEEGE